MRKCILILMCYMTTYVVTGSERYRRGDNSHYCCTVQMPIKMLTRTRTKVEYKSVKSMIVTGSEPCGFHKKCPTYQAVYRLEPQYISEYYLVPKQKPCPNDKIDCCPGFVRKGQHCVSPQKLAKHKATIDKLIKNKLGPFSTSLPGPNPTSSTPGVTSVKTTPASVSEHTTPSVVTSQSKTATQKSTKTTESVPTTEKSTTHAPTTTTPKTGQTTSNVGDDHSKSATVTIKASTVVPTTSKTTEMAEVDEDMELDFPETAEFEDDDESDFGYAAEEEEPFVDYAPEEDTPKEAPEADPPTETDTPTEAPTEAPGTEAPTVAASSDMDLEESRALLELLKGLDLIADETVFE